MIVRDFITIPIMGSPNVFNSWEDKIKEDFSCLHGYEADLKTSNINDIVESILFQEYQDNKTAEYFINLNLNKDNYISYLLGTLLENTEENADSIKKIQDKIQTLKSGTDKKKISEVFVEVGIIDIIYLAIPYNKLTKDYMVLMGEDTYLPMKDLSNLFLSYYGVQISSFGQDSEKENYLVEDENQDFYKDKNQEVSIYIYSRALEELVNITNYISTVSTNVTKSGGNFALSLNCLNGSLERENNKLSNNSFFSDTIIQSDYPIFIQNIIRENDLIFIKFEKIEVEQGESTSSISEKYWDMIGLVDETRIISSAYSLSIETKGRDLIKLLIEDQNFFIPYQFANNQKTTFGGASNKVFKRLFASGEYQLQFIYSLRSIESTIGFILGQLANIEILSESGNQWLKQEYGDRLSKEFDVKQSGLIIKNKVREGIWGLIKFDVDSRVLHYRIADSSISSPDGSILNQLQKICQEPFVELLCDTFQDTYHIVARKPPFDYVGICNNPLFEISETNAISENLSFDTDIFSIFQLSPQGAILGGNDSLPLAYIPMIVLDEYVKIWGNKLYNAVTNYIDYDTYCRPTNQYSKKNPKYNFIEDLCWLIEQMAYKPFTRRGTITIRGERRIKRGTWILYDRTGEIFYVNGVSNSATIGSKEGDIDRITTLEVERGMVSAFLNKSKVKKDNSNYVKESHSVTDTSNESKLDLSQTLVGGYVASYFNLIDLPLLKESLRRNLIEVNNSFTLIKSTEGARGWSETNSIVNKAVFDFFRKGNQFKYDVDIVGDKLKNEIHAPNSVQNIAKAKAKRERL